MLHCLQVPCYHCTILEVTGAPAATSSPLPVGVLIDMFIFFTKSSSNPLNFLGLYEKASSQTNIFRVPLLPL
jgi:hypothetical protein